MNDQQHQNEAACGGSDLTAELGYCPVCGTDTESLPEPAAGTCSRCFNHQMKSCRECENFVSSKIGGLSVGVDRCKGSPDGRWFDWHYARHSETKCGAGAKWGKFTNKVNSTAAEGGQVE